MMPLYFVELLSGLAGFEVDMDSAQVKAYMKTIADSVHLMMSLEIHYAHAWFVVLGLKSLRTTSDRCEVGRDAKLFRPMWPGEDGMTIPHRATSFRPNQFPTRRPRRARGDSGGGLMNSPCTRVIVRFRFVSVIRVASNFIPA